MKPVPASIEKRGLLRISDNLQPGDEIDWNWRMLNVFRSELEARFIRPAAQRKGDARNGKNTVG